MIDRTLSTANRFRNRELERAEREFKQHLPSLGSDIYDTLVGDDFLAWIKQGPINMFRNRDHLRIKQIHVRDEQLEIGIDLIMGGKRPTPAEKSADFPSGSIADSYRNIDVVLDGTHEHWEYLVEPAQALSDKRNRIRKESGDLISFTKLLLKEHTTLGPALRMWYPLWDLLDRDDRDRQGQRPQAAPISIPAHITGKYDVRLMTTLVARIKLSGV
jgi:hypothetical protein